MGNDQPFSRVLRETPGASRHGIQGKRRGLGNLRSDGFPAQTTSFGVDLNSCIPCLGVCPSKGDMNNFSMAGQRFGSMSRVFELLPAAMHFLELTNPSKGDNDDQHWARALLRMTGPLAYRDMLGAALATDAMLVIQHFLREDDKADSCSFLKAAEALRRRAPGTFFLRRSFLEVSRTSQICSEMSRCVLKSSDD